MSRSFAITDGTTRIDFAGEGAFILNSWNPTIIEPKGGGVWSDSPMTDGRNMVLRNWGNVIETLDVTVKAGCLDDLYMQLSKLRRLLEKGVTYWLAEWQDSPVWIEAVGDCETKKRYSILVDWGNGTEGDPFNSPIVHQVGSTVMTGFTISLERQHWLSVAPGLRECVETDGLFNYSTVLSGWALLDNAPVGQGYCMLLADNGDLFMGEAGTIYRSIDNGATWAVTTNAPVGNVRKMCQATNGYIFASDDDGANGGVWRTIDYGANWVLVYNAGAPVYSVCAPVFGGTEYITAGKDGSFQYSSDYGAAWAGNNAFPVGIVYDMQQLSPNLTMYYSDSNPAGNPAVRMQVQIAGSAISVVYVTGIVYGILPMPNRGIYQQAIFFEGAAPNGITWLCTSYITVTQLYPVGGPRYGGYYDATNDIIRAGGTSSIWRSDDKGVTWYSEWAGAAGPVYALAEAVNGTWVAADSGQIDWLAITGTLAETLGRADTCLAEVLFTNHFRTTNLTHVYIDDGGVISANLYPMALPLTLLPAVPVVADAVYFGSSSLAAPYGPFSSLVFDLSVPASSTTSYTLTWEYWSGAAWAALTVHDGTAGIQGSLGLSGVHSIHWYPPANWAATNDTVGVTAFWVRARLSALAGVMTPPVQANRNTYSVMIPWVNIDDADIGGDIPALSRLQSKNVSGDATVVLHDNRLIFGLRSLSRGSLFQSHLNIVDTVGHNITGVTVTIAAGSAYAAAAASPTGRRLTWSAVLADTAFASRVTFSFISSLMTEYYGVFHAYMRVKVDTGASGDITLRLKITTGSGGISEYSKTDYIKTTTDYELLDMGMIIIPASMQVDIDYGDQMTIDIEGKNSSGAAREVYLHDVILIPVDEWAVDAIDMANVSAAGGSSRITYLNSYNRLLDIDSTIPKISIRSLVRQDDGYQKVVSIYMPVTNGEAMLQANADQRLYTLAAKTAAVGAAPNWISEPWVCHTLQAWAVERWFSGIGNQ